MIEQSREKWKLTSETFSIEASNYLKLLMFVQKYNFR